MTKDGVGMCLSDMTLDNSTDIQSIFPKGQKTYTINGEDVRGWFSIDFTSDQLFNVTCKWFYIYIIFEVQAECLFLIHCRFKYYHIHSKLP
jgi:hypothetical protein